MGQEAFGGYRYRKELGAYWPDYDHNPVKCMEFVRHGLPAIERAIAHCRHHRTAIQAGGHAGFWPKRLAEIFDHVLTFEPEPILYECLKLNCTAENVGAFRMGLGALAGRVAFKSHVSAGSWRVDPAGDHEITLTTVDAFRLDTLDALFLDIEGYEVQALTGALETIKRCRPVILSELLPRSRDEIARWMHHQGYHQADRFGRDAIYVPREFL